jgi:hypothetical protein
MANVKWQMECPFTFAISHMPFTMSSLFRSRALAPRGYSPLERPHVRFELARMLVLYTKVSLPRLSKQRPEAAKILEAFAANRLSKTMSGSFYVRTHHRLIAWFYSQLELGLNPEKRLSNLVQQLRKLIVSDKAAGVSVPRELVTFVESPGSVGPEIVRILHFWAKSFWFQIATVWIHSTYGALIWISVGNWKMAALWAVPNFILFYMTLRFILREKGRPVYPRLLLLLTTMTPYVAMIAPLAYAAYVLPDIGLLIFFAKIRSITRKIPIKKLPWMGHMTTIEHGLQWVLRLILLDNVLATAITIWGILISLWNFLAGFGIQRWGAAAGMAGFYTITIAWNLLIPNSWSLPKEKRMTMKYRIVSSLMAVTAAAVLILIDIKFHGITWVLPQFFAASGNLLRHVSLKPSLFFIPIGAALADYSSKRYQGKPSRIDSRLTQAV